MSDRSAGWATLFNGGTAIDVFAATREALEIPHAAIVGDDNIRNRVLLERVLHAVAALRRLLDGSATSPDPAWEIVYLRYRLAEHAAPGCRTWDERMTELEAAKDSGR